MNCRFISDSWLSEHLWHWLDSCHTTGDMGLQESNTGLGIRHFQFFDTLRLGQNGRHFPDDIFKWIFLNENAWINISLKFLPRGPIYNIPTLVQVMAWRRSGDRPLSEPMMVRLPMHIFVTRPQWMNPIICSICGLSHLIQFENDVDLLCFDLIIVTFVNKFTRFIYIYSYCYVSTTNDALYQLLSIVFQLTPVRTICCIEISQTDCRYERELPRPVICTRIWHAPHNHICWYMFQEITWWTIMTFFNLCDLLFVV